MEIIFMYRSRIITRRRTLLLGISAVSSIGTFLVIGRSKNLNPHIQQVYEKQRPFPLLERGALGEPAVAQALIYYVDINNSNASDSNSGTSEAAPWKTLQKAATSSSVIAGDTVLVKNGTYTAVVIEKNGTPTARITYAAYPGHRPLVKANAWEGIKLNSASYINIRGFEVTNSMNNGSGIGVQNSHHILISGNFTHDCGLNGIGIVRSDYVTVEDNVSYRNAFTSEYQGSGISFYQSWDFDNARGYHNVIRGNRCYDNENKVGKHTDGNGIIYDDSRQTQNIIPPPNRLNQEQLGGCLIENNICYNNGGRGIHVFLSSNVLVINNTVYNNQRDSSLSQAGEFSASLSRNIIFRNNITFTRPNGKCITVFTDSTSTPLQFEFNLLNVNETMWGSLNAPFPIDETNIISDPLFVNKNAGDFRLSDSSPAINRGTSKGAPSIDFNKITRPQGSAVDIGAYEWVAWKH